jgi:ribonuclease HII
VSTSPKNLLLFPEWDDPSPADPFLFEGLARSAGYRRIAGVDEAGRGPLAGPVVAAAVILPPDCDLEGVKDSKQMTARAREEAFGLIQDRAVCTGIGVVSRSYIDEHNILRAALEAMRRAVSALDRPPDFLLVDGISAPPLSIPQRCLKKGDQRSRSISAASVLAKVYRDRIMSACHHMYPMYGFDNNKGYGTRQHREALNRYGPCPLHRLTFRGVPRFDQRKA